MNKPTIETMINTCALVLSTFGTNLIILNHDGFESFIKGITIIIFAAGLEFFKYFGRNRKWW